MITFNPKTDIETMVISRLKQTIMSEPVFIEPLNMENYIVYDSDCQLVCSLQFGKKQETRYNPYKRFVRSIMTKYTTFLASAFKPEDINSLVSAIESAYRKQLETESTNQTIKEANRQKLENINRKKRQFAEMFFCDSIAM